MHSFCPGNPFTPNPFTMNRYPAVSVNFRSLFTPPVNKSNGRAPVVTNNTSKFFPPNAASVTASVGMLIF